MESIREGTGVADENKTFHLFQWHASFSVFFLSIPITYHSDIKDSEPPQQYNTPSAAFSPRQLPPINASPSQVGSIPDQCPVSPHVRTADPLSVHPSGHVNSHTVPETNAPLQLTFTFPGTSRLGHSATANDISMVGIRKTSPQNG